MNICSVRFLITLFLAVLPCTMSSCMRNRSANGGAAPDPSCKESLVDSLTLAPSETTGDSALDTNRIERWEEISDKYGLNGIECVVVSKEKMRLYVIGGDGRVVRSYGMACGKVLGDKLMVDDMRTPEGKFLIKRVDDASEWTHDFKDGKGPVQGAYGPFFVWLSTPPFTGIGIHGTHDPSSIGSRASEGCIRLANPDIEDFVLNYVKVGMPVVILEDKITDN